MNKSKIFLHRYYLLILFMVLISVSGCTQQAQRESMISNLKYKIDYCETNPDFWFDAVIDSVKNHYCIFYLEHWVEYAPANIPLDAIEYGLSEFSDLKQDYIYFKRMSIGFEKGLKKYGHVQVFGFYNQVPYSIAMLYNPKEKHLIVSTAWNYPNNHINAIDLSDVDVSIK